MKGAVNMFCKNCGYQNADDAKRCSKCGSPLHSFQNKMASNYNNVSNVNQVNQGQMYYSSTPVAQRKSKLPIIIVASILAVVLLVGGIFGFLFISLKNSVVIPEWSDTITVMFNDIKKEGNFETAINKHSFENQFKDMPSDQRVVLSVLDALIQDMSFRCSNYKDVFYYDVGRNKPYYGFERYYEQNPNIKKPEGDDKHVDIGPADVDYMAKFKESLYKLRENGVIKDSDVVNAYVIGKFDLSAEGTISLFGQTTDVDKTWKNNQVELICINGEWKIVEFSTDVFDNLPGQDVDDDGGDDLIIY